MYKGCTDPMKDIPNYTSSTQPNDKTFRDKELWESEHVMDVMRHTRRISE